MISPQIVGNQGGLCHVSTRLPFKTFVEDILDVGRISIPTTSNSEAWKRENREEARIFNVKETGGSFSTFLLLFR